MATGLFPLLFASVYLLFIFPALISNLQINSNKTSAKILALFSGTNNDLGLDHRLGRQVLKLAIERAKSLHPNELEDIQLIVQHDDTDCNNLNSLPNWLAEQYYIDYQSRESSECGRQKLASIGSGIDEKKGCSNSDLDGRLLDAALESPLDHHSYNGSSIGITNIHHRIKREANRRDVKQTGRWLHRQVDAILGPSCDYLVDLVARMAAFWGKPIYTMTSVGAGFSRKDIYSTLTRLSPSIDHLIMFMLKVLEKFKWRHLAIIADRSQVENVILLENLQKTIDRQRYLIPIDRKLFFYSEDKFNPTSNQTKKSMIQEDLEVTLTLCSPEAKRVLLEAKKVARVFALLINDHQMARRLLLCAYELGMNNGEYSFLAFNLGLKSTGAVAFDSSVSQSTDAAGSNRVNQRGRAGASGGTGGSGRSSGSPGGGNGNGNSLNVHQNFDWYSAEDEVNNLIARQMYESLMVFSVDLPTSDEFNLFVEQTLDMTHQEYPSIRFERSSIGPVAVALHDSLLLAVEALIQSDRKLATEQAAANKVQSTTAGDHEDINSLKFNDAQELSLEEQAQKAQDDHSRVPLMWNQRYSHGLISSLQINTNGDQELDYVLSDLEPEMGLMRPVASYSKEKRAVQLLPNSYIHWPMRMNAAKNQMLDNDEPPPDEPECGFTGEAERCVDRQNLYAALCVVALLASIIATVATISLRQYYHIKYQMQLDDYWWRINWCDLQFLQAAGSLNSNAQSVVHAIKTGGSIISVGNESGSGYGASLVVAKPHEVRRALARSGATTDVSGGEGGGGRGSNVAESATGGDLAGKQQDFMGNRNRRAAISVIVTSESMDKGGAQLQQKNRTSTTGRSEAGTRVSSLVDNSCIIRSEFSAVVKASLLAMYKNELVIVKRLNATTIEISRELLVELKSIRELICDNLAKFIGLCIEPDRLSIVYEYCSRGSLQDMLLNESVSMDWTLKYSIIGDLLSGLNFIHTTLLDFHGRLKSTNLVLDSRFTVKITDFGLQNLYNQVEPIENRQKDEDIGEECDDDDDAHSVAHSVAQSLHQSRGGTANRKLSVSQLTCNMDSVSMRAENTRQTSSIGGGGSIGAERAMRFKNRGPMRYYWTAPEHLRSRNPHSSGSKRGDIYALGIILSEILTRKEPYHYGTNAKPHWPTIRKTRRHQQAAATAAAPSGGMTGGSDIGLNRSSQLESCASETSGTIGSLIGRQARKAQSKLRRNTATVKPTKQHQVVAGVGGIVSGVTSDAPEVMSIANDSESLVSGASSHQSGATALASPNAGVGSVQGTPVTSATGGPNRGKRISITMAIDEEPVDKTEADEALDEMGAGPCELGLTRESKEKRLDPEEILDQLRMGIEPEPVRPYLPNYVLADTNPKLVDVMRACWSEAPNMRPTVAQVRQQLRRMTHGAVSKNYLDNLLDRLQNYAANLERIVDSKSADIVEEKQRTEELLYQLVPKFVADKLKRNEPIVPQVFDGVTIFFSDIVGFEKYSSVMSPCELVDLLNNIYSSFESIISSFDVTKIEVILDQYLVAAGISLEQQNQEAYGAGQQVAAAATTKSKQEEINENVDSFDKNEDSTGNKSKKLGKPKRKILGAIRLSSSEEKANRSSLEQGDGPSSAERSGSQDGNKTGDQSALDHLNSFDSNHYKRTSAEQIARMALCIRDLVKSFHFRQNLSASKRRAAQQATDATGTQDNEDSTTGGSKVGNIVAATFNIRIGIHSGKVCAGIVGVKRPKYCLIGDTVNVASRMHTNSKANRIQISADTRELLKMVPGFNLEPRGRIEVKGKGTMETYWLESSY